MRLAKGDWPEKSYLKCSEKTRTGGTPNPYWIEWLMGWPIGWTAVEPWATGRYQQFMRWRSAFSINA